MSLIGALKSTGRYLESGDLGRRALNVASLGTYMHPADTENYLKSTLTSFDPRTRGGALSLASLLVPGSKRGIPTAAQQMLLDRIYNSSRMGRGQPPVGVLPFDALRSPSAMHLGLLAGEPMMTPGRIGQNVTHYEGAANPLGFLSDQGRELGHTSGKAYGYLSQNRDSFYNLDPSDPGLARVLMQGAKTRRN